MGLFRKTSDDDAERAQLVAELAVLNGVLRQYPPGAQLNFGAPSRCPGCGNFGFVQGVNHPAGICNNSCLGCHLTWVITRRALRAHAAAATPAVAVPAPTIEAAFRAGPTWAVSATPTPTAAPPAPAPVAPPVVTAPVAPDVEPPVTPPLVPAVEPAVAAVATPPVAPDPLAAPAPALAPAPTPAPAPVIPSPATIDLDQPAVRVLVVEDNPFDLATLEALLAPFGAHEVEVIHAATRAEGEDRARAGGLDVVVLDLDLPDSTGITTVLEWQHAVSNTVPVIATADEANAELIQQARAVGVVHVVQKAHLDQLAGKGEAGSRQLLQLLRTTARRSTTTAPTRTV